MHWKNYFVIASLCSLGMADCSGIPPAYEANIYFGDRASGGMIRCISPADVDPCLEYEILTPDDPEFENLIGTSLDYFIQYQEIIMDRCKEWKK